MKGKLALAAVFALLINFFSGCSKDENPVNRYEYFRISGKVIGSLFNAGAPGLKVIRGNDIMYTDALGEFYFGETSENPFKDMYVSDSVHKTGSIFRNVSAGMCYLPHTVGDMNINNFPQAFINVSLPGGMGTSNKIKVFFTDNWNVNGIGTEGYCMIYLPDGKSVQGSVYVLLYTVDANNIATSFDKFGKKEFVNISPGSNVNLIFTDSMLNYNPPEVNVSGTITNIPPHSSSYPSFFMLSFSPRNANYYYFDCLISEISGNSFNFLIPGSLPVSYYPLLKLFYSDSSSMQIFTSNVNYLLPGNGIQNLVISNPEPPQIISPAPSSIIDSSTIFSLYTNYSDRIFHIGIENVSRVFHIYTYETRFSISDLYKLGIGGLEKNTSVTIKINAIGKYESVNEFVYSYYHNISGYTSQPVQQSYMVKP